MEIIQKSRTKKRTGKTETAWTRDDTLTNSPQVKLENQKLGNYIIKNIINIVIIKIEHITNVWAVMTVLREIHSLYQKKLKGPKINGKNSFQELGKEESIKA